MVFRLSPPGWDRINLSGDYIWSDDLHLDTWLEGVTTIDGEPGLEAVTTSLGL